VKLAAEALIASSFVTLKAADLHPSITKSNWNLKPEDADNPCNFGSAHTNCHEAGRMAGRFRQLIAMMHLEVSALNGDLGKDLVGMRFALILRN
jgi:hypothetical protein